MAQWDNFKALQNTSKKKTNHTDRKWCSYTHDTFFYRYARRVVVDTLIKTNLYFKDKLIFLDKNTSIN